MFQIDDFKANHLSTITQRASSPITTPKNTHHHYKSDVLSTTSKKSLTSPNKPHRRSRH
ncbi:unnamed protein product, partial [Rotaria magnacalcarata]